VKVGDGAQLEQKVVDQVADTVSVKLSEGTQEFEMTLNPEELGKVQIKLVFENGKAQVFMTCSDSEVQKALAANIQAVKQIIESNTGQEATVVVQTDSDKMGNYEDQRNGENNHHESNSEENNGNAGGSEAETLSFIQQLRLGLVEDQAV
jgi:flagellar hook-length control protein FliK